MDLINKRSVLTYSLFIHPKDLQDLKSDIWNDDTVPAKMKFGKKQYNIGICYRGEQIRNYPKKSYRIEFQNPSIFNGAREIHLNAEYRDPSFIRSQLSFDFFSSIGTLSPYT